MAYADNAALAVDPDFNKRLGAALYVEALGRSDALSDIVLSSSPADVAAGIFMPFISSAPTFGDQYATGGQEAIEDLEILSAIQASWTRVAQLRGGA